LAGADLVEDLHRVALPEQLRDGGADQHEQCDDGLGHPQRDDAGAGGGGGDVCGHFDLPSGLGKASCPVRPESPGKLIAAAPTSFWLAPGLYR
jgi:hypothetical protein